jgi:hypothetical protein
MMRVVAVGAALTLAGGLVVGCQGDSGQSPFRVRATESRSVTAEPTRAAPPPSVDRVTTKPPTSTGKPTATTRADVSLTAEQAKRLVAGVALTEKDWGPTYVAQEQGYEYTALDRVVTGTDCKQVLQGTVPGALATMVRYVYIPDGKPSVDNLSKTLATSSATAYTSTAAARTDMQLAIADARRCPNQVLAGDERLNDIEVLDLTVESVDEVHVARAQWVAVQGGSPFRYVWVTARQGQVVLTAAVVDRGDKTFESAKNQAIDALAEMVVRTTVQLG